MSNVSIYGKKWIDLVFEGKNKEYGAYQLRQENQKTTLTALIFGLLFVTSVSGLGMLLSSFGEKPVTVALPDIKVTPVTYGVEPTKPVVPPAKKNEATPFNENPNKKDLTNPVIVRGDEPEDDVNTNKQNGQNTPEGTPQGTGTETGPNTSTSGTPGAVNPEPEGNPGIVVAGAVDKLPLYPGGIEEFRAYVGRHFESPQLDVSKNVRIFVSFVVEIDGRMTDIKVINNPGHGLDKEAIRVLKSMKAKWEPGLVKGQPVRTAYTLPITVKID